MNGKTLFPMIAAAALALSAMCSCEKEIRYTGGYDGEKMVLYACANPESPLAVEIYKSKFILDPSDRSCSSLWSGAKVSGEAGGRTIAFRESEDTPGMYLTDFVPVPGETVTLKASLYGVPDVSASATIPGKADYEIVSWSVEPDTEYRHKVNVRVRLKDPAGEHNMYRINAYTAAFEHEGWYECSAYTRDIHFRDAGSTISIVEDILGGDTEITFRNAILDDSTFDGETLTIDLWFYAQTFYDPGLYYGEDGQAETEPAEFDPSKCAIGIDCLSEDLYLYSRTLGVYNDSVLTEIFGEPVSIHSNVRGGIGCFGAIAPSIKRLED